jgi:hypothetical protein
MFADVVKIIFIADTEDGRIMSMLVSLARRRKLAHSQIEVLERLTVCEVLISSIDTHAEADREENNNTE